MSNNGNNNKPSPQRPSLPAISEHTLQQLIETQAKEQQLRSQELAIRAKEMEVQAQQASEILAAQERDRDKARTHARSMQRGPLICIGALVVAILIFIGWALYMNKDQTVMEIIRTLVSAGLGGLGGYGIGKAKKKPDEDE